MEYSLIIVLLAFVVFLTHQLIKSTKSSTTLRNRLEAMEKEKEGNELAYNLLHGSYLIEQEKNRAILSQKKSSETRLGAIAENLVPLLTDIPYDPKNLHHLGMPIDYLYFDYDQGEIVFIEVKSGNAKESSRQKLIKRLISTGKVYYEKLTINEKGIKITRERNGE